MYLCHRCCPYKWPPVPILNPKKNQAIYWVFREMWEREKLEWERLKITFYWLVAPWVKQIYLELVQNLCQKWICSTLKTNDNICRRYLRNISSFHVFSSQLNTYLEKNWFSAMKYFKIKCENVWEVLRENQTKGGLRIAVLSWKRLLLQIRNVKQQPTRSRNNLMMICRTTCC